LKPPSVAVRATDEAPFAFLATYTTRLSTEAKAPHLPLGHALSEYSGAANKSQLLSLLLPVQRAAAECLWLKTMVEAGEIYHPLRWTPAKRSATSAVPRRPPSSGVSVDGSTKQPVLPPPAKSKKAAPARKAGGRGQRLTPKKRQAIAERMRASWAERRIDARRRKASEP